MMEMEENERQFYDLLASLVGDGNSDGPPPASARNLEFEPGTLSIFQGSQCLHRVTQCYGDVDRLVAVLCFSTKAGDRNSAKVQEMFWGRSSQPN